MNLALLVCFVATVVVAFLLIATLTCITVESRMAYGYSLGCAHGQRVATARSSLYAFVASLLVSGAYSFAWVSSLHGDRMDGAAWGYWLAATLLQSAAVGVINGLVTRESVLKGSMERERQGDGAVA